MAKYISTGTVDSVDSKTVDSKESTGTIDSKNVYLEMLNMGNRAVKYNMLW